MTEISQRLSAALRGRYVIERELGEGGMATVFLAQDLRHQRAVAVKVLKPEIARSIGADRFLQEIRVAAQLQHPHILPLYESGEADGLLYYVMPVAKGESLRARLERERELPVQEGLRILRDVVDALTEAHEHGVVHRDIKPDNVMVSGRHAVVADFGIAKAVSAAAGAHGVTTSGVAVGTPAYMAPEQAAADPQIDHRVDIYAVGVLAYEILTGRPPFLGSNPQAVLSAHVTMEPDPITRHRTALPPDVADLVMRCLAKRPADRWQSAAELLRRIEGSLTSGDRHSPADAHGAGSDRRWTRVVVAAGAVVAVAVLAVAGLRGGAGGDTTIASALPKVAVLPFENVVGDSSEDYFSDGMTEEVIARLTAVSGVRVISRTSVMGYKGSAEPAHAIGVSLGATHTLTASVRYQGDRLRIVAELTDVATNEQVWARTYDRVADDVFAVQGMIAEEVVRGMGSALRPSEARALGRAPTADLEAYQLYLRGRTELASRRAPSLRRALAYFEEAVARDPGFAEAHAAIGTTHAVLAYYSLAVTEEEAAARAWPAIGRALQLDSTVAEAYATRGLLLRAEWRWKEAAEAYDRAIAINPGYATAYQWMGLLELAAGRVDTALSLLHAALDLDPLSLIVHDNLAMAYTHRREYDRATEWLVRTAAFDPEREDTFVLLLLLIIGSGDYDEFVPLLERVGWGQWPVADRARGDGFEAVLRDLADGPDTVYVGLRAVALTALGERDAAFAAIDRGLDEGDWIVRFMAGAPWADPLRDDPRFRARLRRMRLE